MIKQLAVSALVLLTAGLTSCDKAIYDYEGDCSVRYLFKFRYDHNMKFADAFAHEVKSVTLYAFSQDGVLRYVKTESGDRLQADGYVMELDGISPGEYDFIAWCGTVGNKSYQLAGHDINHTKKEDVVCSLTRKRNETDEAYIDEDLYPGLFHGCLEDITLPDDSDYGIHEFVMPLKKNTNNVHVVLQHLSGKPVDKNDFIFTITDNNGSMRHDNELLDDEIITYHAWYVHDGVAETDDESRASSSVGVAVADLTTGRLIKDHGSRLTVTNRNGDKVLSIPLADYALLIKGHYHDMSDQEYLDRQDDYNMTFFLDENNMWVSSHIIINSWRVVLDNISFE